MSSIKVNTSQIGSSPNTSDHFYVKSNGNGTLDFVRGTLELPTSTLLSVDESDNIDIPHDVIANECIVPAANFSNPSEAVNVESFNSLGAGTDYNYHVTSSAEYAMPAVHIDDTSYGSAIVMDSSGNIYWAVASTYQNVSYNGNTSYVYKITPDGNITTFASQVLDGPYATDLVIGGDGSIYWAILSSHKLPEDYNHTSYIYKITPGGTKTTFASQSGVGAQDTALVFDSSGNLYWALVYSYDGSTRALTAYVYKITPEGTNTQFASQATIGSIGTSLVFDSNGNLYWAIVNNYNGTTYSQTSYVYKITPGGTLTTFASQATTGGFRTDLIFDSSGNLYWAINNYYSGTTYTQTSYVYKITPGGTKTTFASQIFYGALTTALAIDSNGVLYWAVGNVDTGFHFFRITSTGQLAKIFVHSNVLTVSATDIFIDPSDNIIISACMPYDLGGIPKNSRLSILYAQPFLS